ncbi:hypothetical protein EVAR_32366_1 [Eumeta japonica]|uniref:Uncharacterized protein n=1 Tax=Eumeta variegata TaxID=151549 RepID=A0A4C1VJT6_EUMVA|nr:hypothetical protein EVAR_32366_1 [Eumeta japonica]
MCETLKAVLKRTSSPRRSIPRAPFRCSHPPRRPRALRCVAIKLEALRLFVEEKRIHLAEEAIDFAVQKSEEYNIPMERRIRSKKRMLGELASSTDDGLTLRAQTNKNMYPYGYDFDAIYPDETESEENIEDTHVTLVPDPIVVRGAGNMTV